MSTKVRTILVESLTALGIAQSILPQLTAVSHVPAWVGVTISGIVQVINAILKDTPPPAAA